MSTSERSVNSGTVAFDSAIRRAMTCWMRVSSTSVMSPLAVPVSVGWRRGSVGDGASVPGSGAESAGAWGRARALASGAARLCGGGAAAPPGRASATFAVPAFAASSTSAFTTRPPGPVPSTACRSMPCSRAMRRASGEALTRPVLRPARGCLGAGGRALGRLGRGGCGCGARRASGAASGCGRRRRSGSSARGSLRRRRPTPSFSRAMTSPIGSVSPAATTISGRPPRRIRTSASPCRSRSRRSARRG